MEVRNILRKKVRRGELTEEQARRIARLVAAAPSTVHPSALSFEAAVEIALRTGRTVYDRPYVALALQLDCREPRLDGPDVPRPATDRSRGGSAGKPTPTAVDTDSGPGPSFSAGTGIVRA